MSYQNNFIGVDPSFRKNGFSIAVLDFNDKIAIFKTFKRGFLEFQDWVRRDAWYGAVICIENSNSQNYSYDTRGSAKVVARKGRNVGTNQAVSQLTVDYCKRQDNFFTIEISPREKGRKWSQSTAFAIMKQDGLKCDNVKLSQDEIDGLQIALKGKQLASIKNQTPLKK